MLLPCYIPLGGFLGRHILAGKSFTIDRAQSGIIEVGNEKRPIVKMVDERIAVGVRLSGMGGLLAVSSVHRLRNSFWSG